MTPQEVAAYHRRRAREALQDGHLKLLRSALNWVWTVKASVEGNIEDSKALPELRSAMDHINEAAYILGLRVDAPEKTR